MNRLTDKNNQIHHNTRPLSGWQQPLPERLKVASKELDMPREGKWRPCKRHWAWRLSCSKSEGWSSET